MNMAIRTLFAAAAIGLAAAGLAHADAHSDAQAGDRATIVTACGEMSNMPQPICECIADRAQDDLNADAYAFFIAVITQNEAEQERLRATAAHDDLGAAAMFFTTAPGKCAQQSN